MACNIDLPQAHDNVMVTDAVSRTGAGLGLPPMPPIPPPELRARSGM